jgi:RND family efflux transporter MFP subunit
MTTADQPTPPRPQPTAEPAASGIPGLLPIPENLKAGAPSASRRRWLLWASAAAACLAAVLYALQPRSVAVSTTAVALVSPTTDLATLTASGYLVAQRRAALASKASGRLVYLAVREGSRVKAGDLLARLDARDVAAQYEAATANIAVAKGNLAQAQAELDDARAAAQRARDLVAKNFASPATLDAAQAREQRARASLDAGKAALNAAQFTATAARAARDETDIHAPFDGVVVSKSANVGDVITPFSNAAESKGAVLTLADLGTLEAEVDVAESNLGKVSTGQSCEITLDAFPEQRFAGLVVSIVPAVDRAKATVKVKVRFEQLDERFLPDMSAKVTFLSRPALPEERAARLMIPKTALRNGQVYRIDEQQVARAVTVKTGRETAALAEITDGLKMGDVVANPIPDTLKDGMQVSKPARR